LKGFRKRHGVRVELFAEPMTQRARPHTEIAAYRIVQEALTNVAKHAQATVCRVSLQQSARSLLVTIDDDGVGFDLAEVERERARRGLGLIGIRERVAQLHGTLRIETAPGRGTCVTVELPALLVVPGAQAAGPECVDGIPASTGEAR
jgi:signal transduction histidine kinase